MAFVPTDNDIGDDGDIVVTIGSDFYLDAELNGENVGTWCVDSETVIFTGEDRDNKYQVFDPCEDNWEDELPVGDERFNDHYAGIDWNIISYIINQYNVGDEIDCPDDKDVTLVITKNGIQNAIWNFTNPDDLEPTCPVDGSDELVECESGCAIIAEVEGVFGIND